jgi:hypothetical protein
MLSNTFYVPKQSNTYADAFIANGLAALLNEILLHAGDPESSRRINIIDSGSHYLIRLPNGFQKQWIENLSFFNSPSFFLLDGNDDENTPPDASTRSVNETWERVRAYAEQRSALYDQGLKGTDIDNQLQDMEPPHDWTVVAFLGDWRMQARGIYNRAVSGWSQGKSHFRDHVQVILDLYAKPDVDTRQILQEWRKIAKKDDIPHQDTASQLLNPHQGKGQNESKSNALRLDQIKDRPWPEEFLKTCGLWHCLSPRQSSDTKDWKVYIISPRNLTWQSQREAYRNFNKYLWRERKGDATNLKIDITSLLLFYKAWLDYAEGKYRDQDDFDVDIARPEKSINGFYVVQFKLLSKNSYTMVNQSFLSLPSWGSSIQTRRDLIEMKSLLDEHLDIVRSTEESHSDGYDLLKHYRDFVAGENWDAFFDFSAVYSHEILRRYNDGDKWVATFTTNNLRRLFMNSKKPLSAILENTGFQDVAAAIRYSTVVPQSRKARQQDSLYDVRYGLGAELKRKSTVRDEFVSALTDFSQSYNQENVQKLERTNQQMRKDIRTSDLEEIIRLVDEYGSELIANLLIAYGYAREPREDSE